MSLDKVLRRPLGALDNLDRSCEELGRLLLAGQLDEMQAGLASLLEQHGEAHARLQELASQLAERRGDWQAALSHHKRFHALSLQAAVAPALVSREQLLQRLEDKLRQAQPSTLCLVALSARGAPAGALPQLLRQQCRAQDVLALGLGEAMLLMLGQVDLGGGRRFCERMRGTWAQQGHGALALGLTAWRGRGDAPAALLARAETALANSLRDGAVLRTG